MVREGLELAVETTKDEGSGASEVFVLQVGGPEFNLQDPQLKKRPVTKEMAQWVSVLPKPENLGSDHQLCAPRTPAWTGGETESDGN